MTFTARYPGRCVECGEPIRVGDQVTYPRGHRDVVHVACLDDDTEHPFDSPYMREVRAENPCAFCHLTKPCGCEDD